MVFSPADTIVALATAPSRAGIGVVRISGQRAHEVARAILTVSHDLPPRYATLTHVHAFARVEPRSSFGDAGHASADIGTGVGFGDAGYASADIGTGVGFGEAERVVSHRDTWSPGSSDPGSPKAHSPASVGNEAPGGFGAAAPAPLRPIDEVVATFFPRPHSYTAEDVVEISAHGSLALLRDIVRAAIDAGARLAEPGEFTLRAFLNGRLDLVQAEAVGDLIDAVTPLQARVAFDQLEGTLTRAIGALDSELFDLAARLEASVDFPEEGYHFIAPGEAAQILCRVRDGVDALLTTSAHGRVIREGRQIAILGKPNVGKSSLFNQLVGTDRAIVAARPGTTRDMLSETIDFDGIRLGLVDTAGIRVSSDEVEQEGVWRARRAAGIADLVVLVLDLSRPLEEIDLVLLRETANTSRVVILNKADLPPAWNTKELVDAAVPPPGLKTRPPSGGRELPSPRSEEQMRAEAWAAAAGSGHVEAASSDPATAADAGIQPAATARTPIFAGETVSLSLKTGAGIGEVRAAMRAALDVVEPLRDAPVVTNVRHDALLRRTREALQRAIDSLAEAGESASEELVLADLGDARRALEEVTGRRTTEDVLKRIFERFCIGK
jgi:tRNA modification GTPase